MSSRTVSTSTAATTSDYTIRGNAAGASITVSLPPAATSAGLCLNVRKIDAGANTVTVDPNGSELIDGGLTVGLSTQWQSVEIQCNGTSWDVLSMS